MKMASITQISRLGNYMIGGCKSILHGSRPNFSYTKPNWVSPIQACNYTKRTAEARLGIEKPKRPLTPFFKFMTQMRPALLAKNPGISTKDAITWSSKHWHELDKETKAQMVKEYEKDVEDYKKIKAMYEASLTDEQREDIKRVKEEMQAAKEKRKLKAEYKEMGRPKKPMSSYFLFSQTKKDILKSKSMKEYQEKVKQEWVKLTESERTKYEKQAGDLMKKYKQELENWELKMISEGRSDLVRAKPLREKQSKTAKKPQ